MTQETPPVLRCANHPDRETVLRCNRCDKPICTQCAVRTPVGYRCPECVRGQQAVFYNANRYDLAVAGIVSFALSVAIGGLSYALLGSFGWFSFLIAFIVGPMAGGAISEVVRASVKRRRARNMRWVAATACILGIIVGGLLITAYLVTAGASGSGHRPLLLLLATLVRPSPLLLGALVASTVFGRLK